MVPQNQNYNITSTEKTHRFYQFISHIPIPLTCLRMTHPPIATVELKTLAYIFYNDIITNIGIQASPFVCVCVYKSI